jgi:threonine/homoserine/homoserine lactone efflux protein
MKGWQKSLPAALAPLISDGPIIALCLFVLSQVPAWLQNFLYLAGGSFVLFLAYGSYRSWRNFDSSMPSTEAGAGQSLLKAALTNALAPGAYIFWTLVTGPILIAGWRETPVYGVGFLIGFYVTMLSSLAIIMILFGSARQLGPRVNRALLGAAAVALFCFGLYQLWLGITGTLSSH